MPGFDRTGPLGSGPMTGGRRGYCNPATARSIPIYGGGYAYGHGPGLRRGFRCGYRPGMVHGIGPPYGWFPSAAGSFYPPVYPQSVPGEIDMLKEQAGFMKNALDEINRRIDALEKGSAEPS